MLDWAAGPEGPDIGLGFFGALGDVRRIAGEYFM
jgi:hypothetical protein